MRRGWRFWVRGLLIAAISGLIATGMFLFGYLTRSLEIQPADRMLQRAGSVLARQSGAPTETETRVAAIETTFLRLRGEVWPQPDADFVSGGSMTVWGGELIVMDHAGKVFVFQPGQGLVPLDITPPENGLAGYRQLMASEKYRDYIHEPDRIRFNDIAFVDAPGLSGLALSYTFIDVARECYGSRISWVALDPGTTPQDANIAADGWKTLFDTEPCQPFNNRETAVKGIFAGGRMVFSPPSTLYFGAGYYGLDGVRSYDAGLQDDTSAYGKVMAIDIATGASRIVSKGHRNLQGITLDKDGRLWAVEHSERGGDELNLIEAGVDYGFPSVALGTLYSGLPWPGTGRYGHHDGFRQPVFAWLPSPAISALTVIDGIDPSWDGDLLAGSLSNEEFGQSLFHIRTEGERVVFVERIRLKRRIRQVLTWDGRIAVWLDSQELVILTPERRTDPLTRTLAWVERSFEPAMAAQVTAALETCNQCHSYDEDVQGAAPSLNGVVGRRVAAVPYDGYSDALKAQSGRWDPERLAAFLAGPTRAVPGTAMPDPGLAAQPELIEALVKTLAAIDTEAEPDLRYD